MRGLLLSTLLLLTLLSGCLADQDSDGDGLTDAQEERLGTDPDDSDSDGNGVPDGDEPDLQQRLASGDRAYQRTDSEVTVEFDPMRLGWVAHKTVTLSNDLAGYADARLGADTINGDVSVEPWSDDAYQTVVDLRGTGRTEQEAREVLATMTVLHEDLASTSRLHIQTTIEMEEYEPVSVPGVQIGAGIGREADLVVHVPGYDRLDLGLGSTNGDITVPAMELADLDADTTNGDIAVSGLTARDVSLDTTNGRIDVTGLAAQDVRLDSTNGDIAASIRPTAHGEWSIDSTNGDLRLEVTTGDAYGYRISADTTNGQVRSDVDNTQVEQEDDDEAVITTNGFSGRDIRVQAELDTTNGNIDVTG